MSTHPPEQPSHANVRPCLRRTEEDALNHILPYISQPMPCVNSNPVQFVRVDFGQPPANTNVFDLLHVDNVGRCLKLVCKLLHVHFQSMDHGFALVLMSSPRCRSPLP